LETSYANAAKNIGAEVIRFDPSVEILKHIKFNKIGKMIHDFLNVEVWTRKMNRELVVKVHEEKPNIILLVGGAKVLFGTLATIKVIRPTCKIVWIWPDTPMNLNANNLNYRSIIDLSATYSKASVQVFNSLGFKNVHWVPLAGDLFLHGNKVKENNHFDCDISFVGMWRPEREKIMQTINTYFSHLKIEIYGNYWKRNCKNEQLMKKWKGNGFYAKSLSNHFNNTKISLNIIDDTNYPAANMRFFEIPTSGGFQICSSCPEMETIFQEGEDILYFKNSDELIEKVNWALNNTDSLQRIKKAAQLKINMQHNYSIRMQQILDLLHNS
jgi:hypothetical protein